MVFQATILHCEVILGLGQPGLEMKFGINHATQGCNQHMLIQPWIHASGTHCCWVGRGNVDSKLVQGFYT